MKLTLRILASFACAVALTACSGSRSGSAAPDPAQPAQLVKTDALAGTGTQAAANDVVTVHYTGWLHDAGAADNHGAKFDSSVDRGTPFTFTLGAGEVIPGWDQGVAGMKIGGKRTLVIPSSLGYGAAGSGAAIPANAALVFDVQLLAVKKP